VVAQARKRELEAKDTVREALFSINYLVHA